MSTTIVFACKSNSCRSQMAEGWAQKWIKAERLSLENRAEDEDVGDRQLLRAFLDGLLVVSVALDESSISNGKGSIDPSPSSIPLSSSPTSSFTTSFPVCSTVSRQIETASRQIECVTCDGELCTSSLQRRKPPKEKAIQAMATGGVDISSYYAKTFGEILPFIANNHRQQNVINMNKQQLIDLSVKDWKGYISFTGLCRVLETASREMGMAYAGVAREDYDRSSGSITVKETADQRSSDKDETPVVDNLIVLCSCPDSLKRQLSDLSKETLDWDIDPPSAAARSGEGDGAYLRVSRHIREKVDVFMDELKRCAMMVDDNNDIDRCHVELSGNNSKISTLALPLPGMSIKPSLVLKLE
mmetsp:Transcript_28133/g.51943  ORF Transcript_28133/g.51943 Transcript_28133/m.51943 type:complete len:358 (+) Transcript_28133:91-1164(+)